MNVKTLGETVASLLSLLIVTVAAESDGEFKETVYIRLVPSYTSRYAAAKFNRGKQKRCKSKSDEAES